MINRSIYVDAGTKIDLLTSYPYSNSNTTTVNALFMGANTVYEPEIDTHLAVAHIAYTTLYDSATGSGNALSIISLKISKNGLSSTKYLCLYFCSCFVSAV